MSSSSAPTCPTCGGRVRLVALGPGLGVPAERHANGFPLVGPAARHRFACKHGCGRTFTTKRGRAQHGRHCPSAPPHIPAGAVVDVRTRA